MDEDDLLKTEDGRWKICPTCGSDDGWCWGTLSNVKCPPPSRYRNPPTATPPKEGQP